MKIPVDWVTDDLLAVDNSSAEHINKFLKNAKGLRVETGDRKKTGKSGKPEKTVRKPAAAKPAASKPARAKTSADDSKIRKKPAAAASSVKAGKSMQAAKSPVKKPAVKQERKKSAKINQQVPEKGKYLKDNVPKKASLTDRMKYYSEKYGEDFTVSREIKPEKKGVVEKLAGKLKSFFVKK